MNLPIAIVGAGSIGAKHAAAAQPAGARVARVVDADPSRAAQCAAPFDAAHSAVVQDILDDPEIRGVVICAPNSYHKDLALDSLRAGKDVLLEKPMGLTASECMQINNATEDHRRILQIGFVHRYTAVGRLAKKIAQQETLGEIYHAKAHIYFRRGVPGLGRWFTTRKLAGGGALIDVGVHLIDLAMHLLNFPKVDSVQGQVYSTFGHRMENYVYESMWAGPPDHSGVFDVEDSAHALVRFQGGATLDLQVAWAGNFPTANLPTTMMGLFGDQGGIAFELFGDHINLTSEQGGALVDQRIEAPEADPFVDQLSDFVRSIETREQLGPSGAEGHSVQAIVDAIYRSSKPHSLAATV